MEGRQREIKPLGFLGFRLNARAFFDELQCDLAERAIEAAFETLSHSLADELALVPSLLNDGAWH